MGTVGKLLDQKGHNVVTIDPSQSVLEAATLMDENHIGALVVLGKRGEVAGVFSERDLMRRVVVKGADPTAIKVGEVMTTHVVCGKSSTTIEQVRALLHGRHFRHLPIVDDGKLVGMISMGDLNFVHEKVQEETIKYLEQYMYKP